MCKDNMDGPLVDEVVRPLRSGFLWSQGWVQRWYTLTAQGVLLCSTAPQASMQQSQAVLPGRVAEACLVKGQYSRPAGLQMQRMFAIMIQARRHRGSYGDLPYEHHLQGSSRGSCSSSSGESALLSATENSVVLFAEDAISASRWVRAFGDAAQAAAAAPPLRLSDRYRIHRSNVLGSGMFATVFQTTDIASGKSCALKMIRPGMYRDFQALMHREVTVWSAVNSHPNVCELLDVCSSDTRLYLVSELCQGGGLLDLLAASRGGWSESDAARVMRQVLEGLGHIHSRGVVHCDVKPENICLTSKAADATVKIIDFSLASFQNCPMEPGGTPEFVAPELLINPEYHAEHGCTAAVDMWSAGVLLYFLLSGETPFFDATTEGVIARVKSGMWAFNAACWADISDPAKSLVSKLLQARAEARPSAREALNHPWFSVAFTAKGLAAAKAPAGSPSPPPPAPRAGGWLQAAAKLLSLQPQQPAVLAPPAPTLARQPPPPLCSLEHFHSLPQHLTGFSAPVIPLAAERLVPVPFPGSPLSSSLSDLRPHVNFAPCVPHVDSCFQSCGSSMYDSELEVMPSAKSVGAADRGWLRTVNLGFASVRGRDERRRAPAGLGFGAADLVIGDQDDDDDDQDAQYPSEMLPLQVNSLRQELQELRARVEAGKARRLQHPAPPTVPAGPPPSMIKSSSVLNLCNDAAATYAPPYTLPQPCVGQAWGSVHQPAPQPGSSDARTVVRRSFSLTNVKGAGVETKPEPAAQILALQQQLLELHAKRLSMQAMHAHAAPACMEPLSASPFQQPASGSYSAASCFPQQPAVLAPCVQPAWADAGAGAAGLGGGGTPMSPVILSLLDTKQALEDQTMRMRQIQLLQQEVEMLRQGRALVAAGQMTRPCQASSPLSSARASCSSGAADASACAHLRRGASTRGDIVASYLPNLAFRGEVLLPN